MAHIPEIATSVERESTTIEVLKDEEKDPEKINETAISDKSSVADGEVHEDAGRILSHIPLINNLLFVK